MLILCRCGSMCLAIDINGYGRYRYVFYDAVAVYCSAYGRLWMSRLYASMVHACTWYVLWCNTLVSKDVYAIGLK